MDDSFSNRVLAAAAAGWCAVLILAICMIAGWIAAVLVMSYEPEWLLRLCGGNVTWKDLRPMYLWGFGALKLMLWAFITLVIWLTLWGRRLRKAA
jgi:uncharacterized membrane protein (DUF485 family)